MANMIKCLSVLLTVTLLKCTSEACNKRSNSDSTYRRISSKTISRYSPPRKYHGPPKGRFGTAKYVEDFVGGSADMLDAYLDMRAANWKHSDKYFHARGNYEAAKRGPGGRDASKLLSDLRELQGAMKGDSAEQINADQEANRWGRNGGHPNEFKPKGLPSKYDTKTYD